MAAMSSGVAGSLRAPRSPIAYARTVPCAIWLPMSTASPRFPITSRYSAQALPAPRNPFGQSGSRDVFDALHQLDQPFLGAGSHRREADAAVAGDNGGHAVIAGRLQNESQLT